MGGVDDCPGTTLVPQKKVERSLCTKINWVADFAKLYRNTDLNNYLSGCVSDSYSFFYFRNVGKVAGTTMRNNWIIPAFCDTFCRPQMGKQVKWVPLWGGNRVPQSCQACVRPHLRCNPGIVDTDSDFNGGFEQLISTIASVAVSFAVVRSPFERAVSIYNYELLARRKKGIQTPTPRFRDVVETVFAKVSSGKPVAHFYLSPPHYEPQLASLSAVCQSQNKSNLWAISISPDIIENLKPVLDEINFHRNVSLPKLTTDIVKTHKTNVMSYSCPWQCYYDICGPACFRGVKSAYAIDVIGLASLYAVPETIGDLWPDSVSPECRKSYCSGCIFNES